MHSSINVNNIDSYYTVTAVDYSNSVADFVANADVGSITSVTDVTDF